MTSTRCVRVTGVFFLDHDIWSCFLPIHTSPLTSLFAGRPRPRKVVDGEVKTSRVKTKDKPQGVKSRRTEAANENPELVRGGGRPCVDCFLS